MVLSPELNRCFYANVVAGGQGTICDGQLTVRYVRTCMPVNIPGDINFFESLVELGTGPDKCDVLFLGTGTWFLYDAVLSHGSDRELVRNALDARISGQYRALCLSLSPFFPLSFTILQSKFDFFWKYQNCIDI